MLLLLYSDAVDSATCYSLGWTLCYICLGYVVFNTIVIVFYSARLLWLLCRRMYAKKRGLKLRMEVKVVMKKLDLFFDSVKKSGGN